MRFMVDNADNYLIGHQLDENDKHISVFIWNSEEIFEDIPSNTKIVIEGIDVYDGYFIEEVLAEDLSLKTYPKDHIVELFGVDKFFKVVFCDSDLVFRFEGGELANKEPNLNPDFIADMRKKEREKEVDYDGK